MPLQKLDQPLARPATYRINLFSTSNRRVSARPHERRQRPKRKDNLQMQNPIFIYPTPLLSPDGPLIPLQQPL